MTLNPKNIDFKGFFGNFWLQKSDATKWMEIDQDYLRTGTAIGSRAFHEHLLRFLVDI